jgi:hypothetical protein
VRLGGVDIGLTVRSGRFVEQASCRKIVGSRTSRRVGRGPSGRAALSLQPRALPDRASCNLREAPRVTVRGIAMARPMLSCPGVMKDIVFVAVTLAFFWVSWVYAKSTDHL